MSTFSKRAMSGFAAEYLVAYKVTKELGWMCRLPGVDVGIDAEIEIVDDNRKSTGRFIKIQVKGVQNFRKSGKATIRPTKKQMNYWQDFAAPVILCCVEHQSQQVYWKVIWATSPFSKNITFTTEDYKIDSTAKEKLLLLVNKSSRNTILESLKILNKFYNINYNISSIGIDALDGTEKEIEEAKVAIRFLEATYENFPWFIDPASRNFIKGIKGLIRTVEKLCGTASRERNC